MMGMNCGEQIGRGVRQSPFLLGARVVLVILAMVQPAVSSHVSG